MPFSEFIPARSISKDMLMFDLPEFNYNKSNEVASNKILPPLQDYIKINEAVAKGDAIVKINGEGTLANKNSDGEISIALIAGIAGDLIPIERNNIVEIPNANFDPNKRVYLTNGTPNLTTSKPNYETDEYFREIGISITENKINLGIKPRKKIKN